jgi:hypothetical protein
LSTYYAEPGKETVLPVTMEDLFTTTTDYTCSDIIITTAHNVPVPYPNGKNKFYVKSVGGIQTVHVNFGWRTRVDMNSDRDVLIKAKQADNDSQKITMLVCYRPLAVGYGVPRIYTTIKTGNVPSTEFFVNPDTSTHC